MTMHQKSQSTFNGNGIIAQNTFDARKTYQNNMTMHSQAFSNSSMAKLIQPSHTVNVPTKKKLVKSTQQSYVPPPQQKPAHGNTVSGQITHNLHRRIMSH